MKLMLVLEVNDPNEAIALEKAFRPWKAKVRTFKNEMQRAHRNREASKLIILNRLRYEKQLLGIIYKELKGRREYAPSYKTFQRDMYELKVEGRIHMKVVRYGGVNGRGTEVWLPKPKVAP